MNAIERYVKLVPHSEAESKRLFVGGEADGQIIRTDGSSVVDVAKPFVPGGAPGETQQGLERQRYREVAIPGETQPFILMALVGLDYDDIMLKLIAAYPDRRKT
jgi:hypothetical protein